MMTTQTARPPRRQPRRPESRKAEAPRSSLSGPLGSHKTQRDTETARLLAQVRADLRERDPLEVFRRSLPRLGFGGTTWPVELTHLAATTRLLEYRAGEMPAHLLSVAPPSSGKNWAISMTLKFLPEGACIGIDAGSPRALIYMDADLRHKVVLFAEADSLPGIGTRGRGGAALEAAEDSPAASAIRNLLTEHRLRYMVTIRGEGGEFTVQEIDKPGPSVLFTTATRDLGAQLESRCFKIEMPQDHDHVAAALRMRGAQELRSREPAPPQEIIRLQDYLQRTAPHRVVVPYALWLAGELAKSPIPARMLRDFERLKSLVKAVALLRFTQRKRTAHGAIVATPEDYAAVRVLVNDIYSALMTDTSRTVRETVNAVAALSTGLRAEVQGVDVSDVAKHLGIASSTATARVRKAVREGWLVRAETQQGKSARLKLGRPMPPVEVLPAKVPSGFSTSRRYTTRRKRGVHR